ncbi:MAG: serpin family protein [Planctomycetaceae bacterium]|jgi:serpin B|nr:serpin family protein [Planctomycetaceae bacterium]
MSNSKLASIATILLLTAAILVFLVSADTKPETVTKLETVTEPKNVAETATPDAAKPVITEPEKSATENKLENKQPEQTAANDFLFRFYRTLRDQIGAGNNTTVSPYGVSCLGEMLMYGAEGETKQALQNVFVPSGLASKRTTWFHLSKEQERELPLVVANGIWVQKGFPICSGYTITLQSLFNLQVTEADFTNHASEECTKINAWIAEATKNKITKLFESLDAQSRIVLVNTLNFQGKWAIPFNKSATKPGTFYCTENKTVEIPLMQNTFRLNYTKNDLYQAAAIPYEKNRCSMIIVLPNKTSTLDQVETILNEDSVSKMVNEMILEQVELTLPVFEIESDIDLKPILSKTGAGLVFDLQKADFSGMSEVEGLYVDRMIQKVFLRVDESGTEAVAGTGADIVPKSANISEISPLLFRADHPFLFLIRDNTSGIPLFIGRYVAP